MTVDGKEKDPGSDLRRRRGTPAWAGKASDRGVEAHAWERLAPAEKRDWTQDHLGKVVWTPRNVSSSPRRHQSGARREPGQRPRTTGCYLSRHHMSPVQRLMSAALSHLFQPPEAPDIGLWWHSPHLCLRLHTALFSVFIRVLSSSCNNTGH